MRTHTLIASSLLALALCAASEARAAGSFFVAELNQGLGVPLGFEEGYTPGYALGLSLGVGGKFSGNPIRFYLMGHFNTASFSADRVYNGRQRLIDREVTDLNLGLRLLFPVDGRNLRVFAELGLGSAQVDSAATSPELPGNIRLLDTDTDFALFTALGLQYRLAYWFSAGAKADFATIFDEDNIDVITRATSDEQGGQQVGRLNLYLTATLHF
jgi:hypothetical protein